MPYKDREAARACDRRYNDRHREFRRASWREWPKRHREQANAIARRKLHRRKLRLFRRDGWRCVYCRKRGTTKTLTRDHKIPRSKNGPSTLDNLVTACRSCNCRKGVMSYWAFMSKTRLEATPTDGPPAWFLAENPLELEDEERSALASRD